jgi:RNA polymerase sigma factor (sigma-70 family)
MNDWQLLDQFASDRSDESFRIIVERYGGLVYHTALRQLGNTHKAEEATQAVFIALAQKAGKIPRNAVISSWLFRAARFAVSNLVREEARRQRREQKTATMEFPIQTGTTESVWAQISPHLNDALAKLSEGDRQAVLIRFFEEKSHREVASTLGISEDAAKMRVSRGLEKLRLLFQKKGLGTPSACLAAALSTHGAQAAPVGLSTSIAAFAAVKGTATTLSFVAAKGILKLMVRTKTKIAIVTGTALLFAGATATLVLQKTKAKPVPMRAKSAVDRSTPKGSLRAISQALETGDPALFVGSFSFASPYEGVIKGTLERLVATIGKYRQAAVQEFGAESAQASFASLPFKLPAAKIESAHERIEAETANVELDPRDRPVVFTRSNGEWKTTLDAFFDMSPAALGREGTNLISGFERVMSKLKSGKYTSAVAAAQAIHERKK